MYIFIYKCIHIHTHTHTYPSQFNDHGQVKYEKNHKISERSPNHKIKTKYNDRMRKTWQPTPGLLPRESHGQWSLVGYVHRVARVRRDLVT